jgi:membrane-associated phospholipid phosphatase
MAAFLAVPLPAAATQVKPFSDEEKWFIAGSGVVLGIFELRQDFLAPDTCRWCDSNDLDDYFRARIRRETLEGRKTMAILSDFTGLGSPFYLAGWSALLANGGSHEEIEASTLAITESAIVSLAVCHIVKRAVARQRPLVRYAAEPLEHDPDNNLSFYSGHTTLAFSAATTAGRMADLHGYEAAPAIWATGMTLAAATGYFRMAADKHYFTDVLVGAATGALVGYLVAERREIEEVEEGGATFQLVVRLDGGGLSVGPW